MLNGCRVSPCHRIQLPNRQIAGLLHLATLLTVFTFPAWASQASTATTLALSTSSVALPSPVTLTASVTAGGARLTWGSVTFCDAAAAHCEDAAVLGVAQLTMSGNATLILIPSIGSHSYRAVFSGTASAAASSSSVQTLTVIGPDPTATTIASSGGPSGYGLTTTVTGVAIHPPLLTGTVSFQDTSNGNNVLGIATLGSPVFTQSFLSQGSRVNTGVNPAVAGVADFNGDGKPDLAVMNSGDMNVSVLLGNGDGTFTAASTAGPVGTIPCVKFNQQSNCAIAVGDFDRNGTADLALTSGYDNTVIILLGNGNGTFTTASGSPISVGNFPEALKTGDFNRDGLLDLAVANANDNTVSILLGNGNGGFTAASGPANLVGNFPFFLAVADFNGDHVADIAVVNGDDSSVSILLGKGDGTFTEPNPPNPVGTGATSIVAGDFNGDGKIDLAVANYISDDVEVLLGKGDGTFTEAAGSPIAVGIYPFAITTGDFNDDGNTDLAVANSGDNTVTILQGAGDGTFTAAAGPPPTVGDAPNDVVAADFNGDGAADLAVVNLSDNNLSILLNHLSQTAVATFANVTLPGTGTHYVDANYSGNTYLGPSTSLTIPLMGSAVPTTLTLSASAAQQLVTMPLTFMAQLTSTTNAIPTGSVSFFDGGVLLGTAPINAAGQAVIATSSLTAGGHTITGSYAGNGSFLPSTSSTALSITISDLQITHSGGNTRTILPGTAVSYTFQVSPVLASTFLYDVGLTAAGLPPGATHSFSPSTLTAGGETATVTLTVQTASLVASNTSLLPSPYKNLLVALGLLFPLLGTKPLRRRLRQLPGMLAVLLFAALSLGAVAGLSGCSNPGFFAQAKTTYAIAVTATSGTVQRSDSVPLSIQ
jgi:hypothetical protein